MGTEIKVTHERGSFGQKVRFYEVWTDGQFRSTYRTRGEAKFETAVIREGAKAKVVIGGLVVV